MLWWQNIHRRPRARRHVIDIILQRRLHFSTAPNAADPEKTDKVMLIRGRVSRIFFLRSFFDYPVSLKASTFINLGLVRTIRAGVSFVW